MNIQQIIGIDYWVALNLHKFTYLITIMYIRIFFLISISDRYSKSE